MTMFSRIDHRNGYSKHCECVLCQIEHIEYLGNEDWKYAYKLLTDEMLEGRIIGYLVGWASEYHRVEHCESMASRDFEERAYGRHRE